MIHAGLPTPLVNADVFEAGEWLACVDLWLPQFRLAVEYEGSHHQEDRAQYVHDIGRYERLRRGGIAYVQVTRELARHPAASMRQIHAALVERGYAGPPPEFGRRWRELTRPVRLPRRGASATE